LLKSLALLGGLGAIVVVLVVVAALRRASRDTDGS
jgi:hypothetical protein